MKIGYLSFVFFFLNGRMFKRRIWAIGGVIVGIVVFIIGIGFGNGVIEIFVGGIMVFIIFFIYVCGWFI